MLASEDSPPSPAMTVTQALPLAASPITSCTPSVQKLLVELSRALEKQEVSLFSISSSDVNESVVEHLVHAKAENKTAKDKLSEILEALTITPVDTHLLPVQRERRLSIDTISSDSIFSPPVSPIQKVAEIKTMTPPGSPSSKIFSKPKRFSFGGHTKPGDTNTSNSSTDDSTDEGVDALSISVGGDATVRRPRLKKEKRSITQFLTLRSRSPTVSPPNMTHSSSTPALNGQDVLISRSIDVTHHSKYVLCVSAFMRER